ncbi:hypothetical protein [Mucilaginibacter gotjawali]|uniref:Uncharacterized protein n=2 Tax=Mucilaginibacter gotjawali TaxID=1550579 RepID=A0A0X8X2X8_9SPHI|nr:hypothetical protein [Mucilaginibacter gotjawali]MBB3056653.1 hypothetical protein [Mucilaginibacter gotjawali]BAU52644.1 hypothetical protein MgSA37_00806 [Mucilaginibacter gotjawali]
MKISKIVTIILFVLMPASLIYVGVSTYLHHRCANSFGTEFNGKRKELHIPIIPSDWPVYHKDENSTIWQEPKVKKGHGFKLVAYHGCELDLEEDHYYFSSKKLQDTVLTMDHSYVNSQRKRDSTIFTLHRGNRLDTITRKQADSIFIAYKIDKDY